MNVYRCFSLVLCMLASSLVFSSICLGGTLSSYTMSAKSYSDSRDRQYKVYKPDGLSGSAPMVMALHGCKQTNDDVLNDWGLKEAADTYGFILVAPFITTYDGLRNENCWGFWFDQHRHEGRGEVEDLHQIGLEVESNFNIDPDERYITGLSSGGAMTVVAAVAHNEYWAAAASASGLPYGEGSASVSLSGQCPGSATFHSVGQVAKDIELEANDNYAIPMMVLQNEDDCTVVQPAGRNIRDSHLRAFGTEKFNSPSETLAESNDCSPFNINNYDCKHNIYTQDGTTATRSLAETVFFNGPLATLNTQDTDHGHYWIGGTHGNEGKWSVKKGPSYPDIIWDFFNRHPKTIGIPIGKPAIALLGDNPMQLNVGDSFSDPGATATDFEDGTLSVTGSCNVDTAAVGEYYCNYSTQDSDGNTSVLTRIVRVSDPNAPIETCLTATDSPLEHINNNRAVKGGSYDLRALSNGDQADIGFSWDSWSNVALTEGESGHWYAQQPEACRNSGGGNGGFVCQQWHDSNLNHQIAGRAYYNLGYFATGSNDSLGAYSGVYTWVRETSGGYFEAGQCP